MILALGPDNLHVMFGQDRIRTVGLVPPIERSLGENLEKQLCNFLDLCPKYLHMNFGRDRIKTVGLVAN